MVRIADVQTLIQEAKKTRFKYLLFWGHTPKQQGVVDKACFSQWYPAAFEEDGVRYLTAEHYMMAKKAELFADHEVREEILRAQHPKQAKTLGRKVRSFDEKIWDAHKSEIVRQANLLKFAQHPDLKQFLLNTQDRVLVEASPYDRIWGIGLGADHPHAERPEHWRGENLLGFALMEAREQLRS